MSSQTPNPHHTLQTLQALAVKKGLSPDDPRLPDIAASIDGQLSRRQKREVDALLRDEPELRDIAIDAEISVRTHALSDHPHPGDTSAPPPDVPDTAPGIQLTYKPRAQRSTRRSWIAIMAGAALIVMLMLFMGSLGRNTLSPEAPPTPPQPAPDKIAITLDGRDALIRLQAEAPGQLVVLLATPKSTTPIGLCQGPTCLVVHDRQPFFAGESEHRAALTDRPDCAFVVALTANRQGAHQVQSGRLDPHAIADALGPIVDDACTFAPDPEHPALQGLRRLAFVPLQ